MGILRNFRFPSQDSYRAVASKGKKLRFGLLSLKILPAPDGKSRFCFAVRKKNGCAAFRNRCRRILRNIFFGEAKNFKSQFWAMAMVKMDEDNANWDSFRECAKEAAQALAGKEI